MKLSKLVNEVNKEQELEQLCQELCDSLLKEHQRQFPSLTEYSYSYKAVSYTHLTLPTILLV